MSMGRAQYAQRNQNTTSFRGTKKGIGPVSNTIVLIVLACLLGLFYLAQVTKTNSFGYQINELTQKHSALQEEHDQLEVASARLQALDRVQNSKQADSLVSVAPAGAINN
jgi:hypothetical protein